MLTVDGTLHSTYGFKDEKGKRHASGIGGYRAVSYHWGQEKPQ
jgi:hypothetical protein